LFSPLPSLVIAPWFLTPLNPVRWYMLATQGLALALILAWMLHALAALRIARPGCAVALSCWRAVAAIPVGYYTSQLFPGSADRHLLLLAGLDPDLGTRHRGWRLGWAPALISAPLWATPRVLPAVGLVWLWSLCLPPPGPVAWRAVVLTLNLLLYAAFCLWLWGNPVAPQASAMLFRVGVQLGPVTRADGPRGIAAGGRDIVTVSVGASCSRAKAGLCLLLVLLLAAALVPAAEKMYSPMLWRFS
jgi:hypothetical protein